MRRHGPGPCRRIIDWFVPPWRRAPRVGPSGPRPRHRNGGDVADSHRDVGRANAQPAAVAQGVAGVGSTWTISLSLVRFAQEGLVTRRGRIMISRTHRRTVTLVAAMAAMLAVCLPASSAQAQGPRLPRSGQAATSAAASAQCTVPVGQRTGAWFCSDGTGPSTAALGPLPAASSIHCHAGWGCWYVDTPSQAEFFSDH
jgi:hypothetical protein